MKRILLLAALFFGIARVFALPVGNPADASLLCENPFGVCYSPPCTLNIFSFDFIAYRVGYYGDFVFNRNLETILLNRHIDYTQMTTNAGYLSLGFWNAFDIFTTFGVTKFRFNTSLGPFNAGNTSPRFDVESSTTFSWSIGAHGTIWEFKGIIVGVEGQYFYTQPKIKSLFIRANVDDYPGNFRFPYTEWQIGAGVAYRYNPYFIPYFAVKRSRVLWEFNSTTFTLTDMNLATIPNLRNGKNWGFAVGLTLLPCQCERLSVTVEGRFADESALFINAQALY